MSYPLMDNNKHALCFGNEALQQLFASHYELGIYCSNLLYHVLCRFHTVLECVDFASLTFNMRLQLKTTFDIW